MRALERMRTAKAEFSRAASAAMHGDRDAAELVQRALDEVNAAREDEARHHFNVAIER